jgi:hypothetical protein
MVRLKNYFFLVLLSFLCNSLSLHGQVKMSASNRIDLQKIQQQLMVNKGEVYPDLLSRYPIYNINGTYYLSFLGKVSDGFDRADLIKKQCLSLIHI